MSRLDDDLDISRAVFMAHKQGCMTCRAINTHDTCQLGLLCASGAEKFNAMLNNEDKYIRAIQAAERARQRKLERNKQANWLVPYA